MAKRKKPEFDKSRYFKRLVGTKETKATFLIVCEGEKTEPNYFKAFKVVSAEIEVEGTGMNTVGVVEEAIRLRNEKVRNGIDYDQVWAVFDRNSFPKESFNEAFSLARRQGIKIAYSIEAFELWYILHFHFYQSALSRVDYCEKLSGLLGHKYDKNCETIYDELLARQGEAIRNAKNLLASHPEPDNYDNNPSTTVFRLVEELNNYKR